MPSAMSRAMDPVGMTFMATSGLSPRRMTEPLPNCLSIWARAMSRALSRSSVAMVVTFGFAGSGSGLTLGRATDSSRVVTGVVDIPVACGRHCRPNRCSTARPTRRLVPTAVHRPLRHRTARAQRRTGAGSALLRRHVVGLADGEPHPPHGNPGVDRLDRATTAQLREEVVTGHALGAHGPEL